MSSVLNSLRNADGSANKAAIFDLRVEDLKAWMNHRLSGEDPYLPLGRSEELPHTLLLQLFEEADPTHPFRRRLDQATRELLEPVLTGRKAPSSPAWLGEILLLAFAIRVQVPREIVRKAFETKRFSAAAYLESDIDIELLDLLAIQEGLKPIEFWNNLLEEPRYCLSAFAALERHGPRAVIQAIPILIGTLRSTPELGMPESRLALPLKRVVERFGIDQLIPLFEAYLSHADRVVVDAAMGKVGIPFPEAARAEMRPSQVYDNLTDAARTYANWLEANVKWRGVGQKPERLNWVRVLDLTTKSMESDWCSTLLAEQGAEVILVRPPQYDPTGRLELSFLEERASDEEARGKFLHERQSKMFLSLNLEISEGRDVFRKLVVDADVLVEGYPPGKLEEWGIGYRHLSEMNARLVYGRIAHREQWGALGERILGDYMAGAYLAMWIIAALNHRDRLSGHGQFLDVSEVASRGVTFADEVAEFPHFKYRGHVLQVDDLMYGKVVVSPPSQLAQKAPPRLKWIGRPTGFGSEEIYRKIFGFKKQDIEDLKKKGVI